MNRSALLLAVACAVLAGAAPARAAAPELSAPLARIVTDAELRWSVPLVVKNPLEVGLYPDSLFLDIEDLDVGETRAERTSRQSLDALLKVMPAVSAREQNFFQHEGLATAERARLTFVLHAHDASGQPHVLKTTVEADPGPLAEQFPSQLLDVGGRKVEVVVFKAARDSGAGPAVLLVHGHASHARKQMHAAMLLAGRGCTVMSLSQPGYGRSEGPADFMGPVTMRAADAALDLLGRTPGVDPSRIAVWGVSRGATVAALLAARRPELKAAVLQAGIYDLWSAHRGTRVAGIPGVIVAEAGRDSAGWRARSALLEAGKVKAAVLVLHGEKDGNAPAGQAHGFVRALEAAGTEVESHFYPGSGHVLPRGDVLRRTLDFLGRRLGLARRAGR